MLDFLPDELRADAQWLLARKLDFPRTISLEQEAADRIDIMAEAIAEIEDAVVYGDVDIRYKVLEILRRYRKIRNY